MRILRAIAPVAPVGVAEPVETALVAKATVAAATPVATATTPVAIASV